VVGDETYGSAALWLSTLKTNYRLKPGHEEKPLIARAAIHAEQIRVRHPDSGQTIIIQAPWPKDLTVAVKYLRRYGVRATR
jgi:23S rRNA-/tRNA-specific pseudouridylate synthase